MTPTGYGTGSINRRILQAIGIWADEDGRGDVFDSNTGFTLPNGASRSSDATWVSNRKANALTEKEREGFAPVCPEFVIELTSPSDRIKDEKANGSRVELSWLG